MVRFLAIQLLTILLFITVCAILFFARGSLCDGAEPMRITISEPLPQPIPYPSVVYKMTDAEFFLWATDQNNKARAGWEKWYRTAPPRWISYGVTTDYKQSRRGSYFGSNYEQGSVRHYQQRYLNPNYYSRPLTIINPYCRPTQPRRHSHTTGVWLSWPAQ